MERFEERKSNESLKPADKEQLPHNVALVERPEARYRILYENHQYFYKHSVAEIRGAHAIALEGITTFSEKIHFRKPLNRETVSYIRENNIPLYLFDIQSDGDYAQLYNISYNLLNIESAVGEIAQAYAGIKAAQAVVKGKMSRRDFLKTGAAAAVGAKGYLAQSIIADESRQLNAQERSLVEAREKISPELDAITFTLRNALWAYKLKTVIVPEEAERSGGKPEIASIVGYEHTEFETMLQKDPKELLEIIAKVMDLLKKALAFFNASKPQLDITAVARYDYDKMTDEGVRSDYRSDTELEKVNEAYLNT